MNKFFDYFYEWFKLDIKKNLEYKIHLIFNFISMSLNLFVNLFILLILIKEFDFLPYSSTEIIFFSFNLFFILSFTGTFAMSKKLEKSILLGELNNWLIRPRNVFYQYFLFTSKTRRLFTALAYFIFILFYIIYYNIDFIRFLIAEIFALFGGIYFIIIICFLDSFAFYFKKNDSNMKIFKRCNNQLRIYPYSLMENLKFGLFFLLIPLLFYGSVVTDYLFGYRDLFDIFNLFIFIFIFSIIFIIGTVINWHYGLKKYEAFN